MQPKTITQLVLFSFILLALITFIFWFSSDPTADFTEKIPGLDNQPADFASATSTDIINIGEFIEWYDGSPADIPGSWPRFRGSRFDNINRESTRLIDDWDQKSPEIVWFVDLGEGHAGPAVMNGKVYLMDYDEEQKADALRCFSLADGKEIWRRWYKVHVKRNHGMARTVPAVTEQYVLTMGPRCHVMCVTADSGKFLWGLDLEKEYQTKVPLWYTGQCPLIDDSLAVIATGGKAMLIGVRCETGELAWQTPNPDGWQMSHSSIMPIRFGGKRMYVYCFVEGMVGISAEENDRGTVLWKTTAWAHSVIAPSPILLPEGKLFITAGYGAGSMLFQLNSDNDQFSIEPLAEIKPEQGLASEQQTPILLDGHLFAVLPKDAGAERNQFVCCHPDDIRKFVWTSGKTTRFGLGPYLIADGKFYLLSDEGVLTIIKGTTSGYEQLGQAQILDGHDAWGPLALVAGRMLLRDSKRMVCLDLRRN